MTTEPEHGVYVASCADCPFERYYSESAHASGPELRAKRSGAGHTSHSPGHAVEIEQVIDAERYAEAVRAVRAVARERAEETVGAAAGVNTEEDVDPALEAFMSGYFGAWDPSKTLHPVEESTGVPAVEYDETFREAFEGRLRQLIREKAGLTIADS